MMNETTSFCILRKCNITPRVMKSICIRSRYLLFVWNFQEVYVYEYKLTLVDGLLEFNGFEETLHFCNGLIAVISTEENVYALDKKGSVFLLNFGENSTGLVNDDDDVDIFDASPDEEPNRQQNLIGVLDKCDELLTVTEVEGGFASCTKCQEKMFVQIWRLDPLEKTIEHSITDTPPCEVYLCCNKVPISSELRRSYFNFLQEEQQNILMVGLSTGQVLSLSCSSDSISTILSTPYAVSSVHWIVDELQHTCIALLVQFLHGAAMLLRGSGSQMLYLAGPVYSALLHSSCNAYVTSDGIDCIVTNLEMHDKICVYECSISPLKGIRSMCKLSDNNVVLVGTEHRCIYWLNVSAPAAGDPCAFAMPGDRLLDSLFASTVCLEKICYKVDKEGDIMSAVALSKRANTMSQYFTILAKVYPSSNYAAGRIKVRVETSCSFAEFPRHIWRLELTVVSPQDSKTEIVSKKLKSTFNRDNPIVCEMDAMPAAGSEILCSLMACIEVDQPWLAFPIGKVHLDAGYFLKVLKLPPVLSLTGRPPPSILNPPVVGQQIDTMLTLTLSQSVLNDELLFAKIFFNSTHRLLKEQWLSLKDKNTTSVDAIFEKKLVFIKLDKSSSSLKISSNRTEACHRVKQAILARIISNSDVSLNEKVYIDAEVVRLSFEVAKLNMDFNQKTLKSFKDSIRNISKSLPT